MGWPHLSGELEGRVFFGVSAFQFWGVESDFVRWLLGICAFLVPKNKVKSRKKSKFRDQKSEKVGAKSRKVRGKSMVVGGRRGEKRQHPHMKLTKSAAGRLGETAGAENDPTIQGRTCAFVRTVRGFLESKCSIDRGLAVQKSGHEIAKISGTVRAVGAMDPGADGRVHPRPVHCRGGVLPYNSVHGRR